jgi:hypothetical protein
MAKRTWGKSRPGRILLIRPSRDAGGGSPAGEPSPGPAGAAASGPAGLLEEAGAWDEGSPAGAGAWRPSGRQASGPRWGSAAPAQGCTGPVGASQPPAQPGAEEVGPPGHCGAGCWLGRAWLLRPSREGLLRPAQDTYAGQHPFNPAQPWLLRPGGVCSGLGLDNPSQAAVYLLFNIPATHNLIYNVY